MADMQDHNHCTGKFIELANELKDSGFSPSLVSAALMSASCIYSTYVVAGNDGGLNPSGVDKIVETYRRNLEFVQQRKREEFDKQQAQQEGQETQ